MRRTKQLCQLALLFSVLGTIGYGRHYIERGQTLSWHDLRIEAFIWLLCYYAWIPLTPAILWLENRFPLRRDMLRISLPVLTAASAIFAFAAFWITGLLHYAFIWVMQTDAAVGLRLQIPLNEFLIEQALFWTIVACVAIIRTRRELARDREQAARLAFSNAQLEGALRKSELETLRLRLNPHFLFNSLQNISMLTLQDARTASRMLAKMGDLLRVALHGNFESETTLSQELELTRAYLDLEKMRFGKKLETRLDVPESLASVPVPSLLLQPIVENAIHHGLASVTGTGVVQVSAFSQNGELVLTVADNGIVRNEEPDAEFPSGYGLGLTRKRLERMYADRARIQISRRPEVGTSVCIYIPLNQPLSRVPNESHALADCG